MKKMIALLITATMILILITGCTAAEEDSFGSGPISTETPAESLSQAEGEETEETVLTEPVTEATEAMTEATELATEATEAMTEATELATEATEAATETTEPMTETLEPETDVPEPSTEATKPETEATETTSEPTESARPSIDESTGVDIDTDAPIGDGSDSEIDFDDLLSAS